MTKKEVQKRVLRDGEPLSLDKFEWDEKTNAFSSGEDYLVLDFEGIDYCTFNTGPNCTFKTGYNCTFYTGYNCTFYTGPNCTFYTGSDCTFKTGYNCTFDTGPNCTFDTGPNCTFNTGFNCTFKTGFNCTFYTGPNCTFDTGYNCTFYTGSDCVVVRRDIYEIIELKENQRIQLRGSGEKGYDVISESSAETVKIGNREYDKWEVEEALKDVKSIN